LAVAPSRRFKLVANLPYNVATPIISNLLVHPELCPALMVVTIQRELAERLRAAPGSEAYGALSVLAQALADVELVRVLPPSVFWPRPRVESAVVLLRPSAAKRAAIPDLAWFHTVVRQVFLHRRKHLRHAVHAFGADSWTKADADALLEEIGLSGNLRAEALDVDEFLALCTRLRERLGPAPVPDA
jgi:16S rRNA (adenine1518-N6/adenine1519-N6)-dimethyltransferase